MRKLSIVVVLMIFVFGIMQLGFAQTNADTSAASSGGSGGAAGPLQSGSGETNSDTATQDSCAKYYTCPDGSMVQYCFISKVRDEDGTVTGVGCGCKDPKSLCPSNVKPLKPVAVSPTTATQISKPAQINVQSVSTSTSTVSKCPINDKLMEEYNQLITELRKVESDDKEKAEEITKKIIDLKQEIAKSQKECKPRITSSAQITAIKPVVSAIAAKPAAIGRCKQIERWESKYAYYKEIYSLSDEDLKKKGYSGREDIKKILKQLSDGITEIKRECGEDVKVPVLECRSMTCSDGSVIKCETKVIEKCGVNTFSVFNQCDKGMFRNVYVECYDGFEIKEGDSTSCKSSLDWQGFARDFCKEHCKKVKTFISSTCPQLEHEVGIASVKIPEPKPMIPTAVSEKPVVADSAEEIKDYYKIRIEKITSQDNVEEQIKNLKFLRDEIDNLIERLLKSKDVITINYVSGLVEKININPGMIKADNVQIKTIGKRVLISVNNKPITIEPREKEVLIKDGNLEVKTSAISIQDNVLRVGNAEVKLTASDVIYKLKISPKEIELKEENAKAVYKIKTEENRKLIWFIPVKIDKEYTIDAVNSNILGEQKPWYSFLTTG